MFEHKIYDVGLNLDACEIDLSIIANYILCIVVLRVTYIGYYKKVKIQFPNRVIFQKNIIE